MSPKAYQVITIQGKSKGFKPIVQGKHKTASEYLRENHENLQLPSDLAPSCYPRRVFGCPESEGKGEKMRETGKEREELKALAQNFY